MLNGLQELRQQEDRAEQPEERSSEATLVTGEAAAAE
jgi:hypothetical protein